MRFLRSALFTVGMLAGFLLGPAALVVAWQLQMVAAADPTPKKLSVAELLDKGPGGNLHVELTDAAFGQPLIEQEGNQWKGVWVPVKPGAGKGPADRLVFYRADRVRNQAELDDLLHRPTLTALVTTTLPNQSMWKVHMDKELRKAYPKLDPAHVTFLAEPVAEVPGAGILGPDVLFKKTVAQVAGIGGVGLLVAGVLCLVLMCLSDRGKAPQAVSQQPGQAAAAGPLRGHEHARLAIEIPISEHRFAFWTVAPMAFTMGGGAVVLALIGLGLLLGAEGAMVEKNRDAVPGLLLFAALALAGGVGLGWVVLRKFTGQVSEMFVCPSGLRWRIKAQQRQVLWEEIAAVDVYQQVVISRQGSDWTGTCTLRFRSGETLRLNSHALSDYPRFVTNVRGRVDAVNQEIGSRTGNQGFGGAFSLGGPAGSR